MGQSTSSGEARVIPPSGQSPTPLGEESRDGLKLPRGPTCLLSLSRGRLVLPEGEA